MTADCGMTELNLIWQIHITVSCGVYRYMEAIVRRKKYFICRFLFSLSSTFLFGGRRRKMVPTMSGHKIHQDSGYQNVDVSFDREQVIAENFNISLLLLSADVVAVVF